MANRFMARDGIESRKLIGRSEFLKTLYPSDDAINLRGVVGKLVILEGDNGRRDLASVTDVFPLLPHPYIDVQYLTGTHDRESIGRGINSERIVENPSYDMLPHPFNKANDAAAEQTLLNKSEGVGVLKTLQLMNKLIKDAPEAFVLLEVLADANEAIEGGLSKSDAKREAINFGEMCESSSDSRDLLKPSSLGAKIANSLRLLIRDESFTIEVAKGFIEVAKGFIEVAKGSAEFRGAAESYGLHKDYKGAYNHALEKMLEIFRSSELKGDVRKE